MIYFPVCLLRICHSTYSVVLLPSAASNTLNNNNNKREAAAAPSQDQQRALSRKSLGGTRRHTRRQPNSVDMEVQSPVSLTCQKKMKSFDESFFLHPLPVVRLLILLMNIFLHPPFYFSSYRGFLFCFMRICIQQGY